MCVRGKLFYERLAGLRSGRCALAVGGLVERCRDEDGARLELAFGRDVGSADLAREKKAILGLYELEGELGKGES